MKSHDVRGYTINGCTLKKFGKVEKSIVLGFLAKVGNVRTFVTFKLYFVYIIITHLQTK